MKRRIDYGREMEHRLDVITHPLPLQDVQQQRAFRQSVFGRLPGEIRQMIYEYVLVAPPSQPIINIRVPILEATVPNVASAEGDMVKMTPLTELVEPCPVAPLHPKISCLAILQTCRQINREAFHIFYASNTFHFTSAPVLIAFLKGIGPVRQAELISLHIEGFVVYERPTREDLYRMYLQYKFLVTALHPDIRQYRTTRLLEGCKNLSRLVLDMRAEEGSRYYHFLEWQLGLKKPVIYLVDESHWKVARHRIIELSSCWVNPSVNTFEEYRKHFPCWARGGKVRVEVEIMRKLEGSRRDPRF